MLIQIGAAFRIISGSEGEPIRPALSIGVLNCVIAATVRKAGRAWKAIAPGHADCAIDRMMHAAGEEEAGHADH